MPLTSITFSPIWDGSLAEELMVMFLSLLAPLM